MTSSGANCKNCGAPVTAPYCPYCGSPTYTPQDAIAGARGKRVHCWYEADGAKHCFDMLVSHVGIERDVSTFYDWSGMLAQYAAERATLSIESELLDFDAEAWADHLEDWRKR